MTDSNDAIPPMPDDSSSSTDAAPDASAAAPNASTAAPADLSTDTATPNASPVTPPAPRPDFWLPAEPLEPPPAPTQPPSALERLGPSPFPRSGFPFLGFLTTVYDHVASHAARMGQKPTSEG